MAKVGFGIVGSGLWSELHAGLYASTPDIELLGVSDVLGLPALTCGATQYDDYQALLADERIEAVSILTPDFTHAEIALAAVRAGKHILIDPPLAMTEEECRAIIDAARSSGSKIMLDFRNRWIPSLQDTRDSIEGKEIGTPEYIDFHSVTRVDIPASRLLFSERTTVAWFSGIHSVDTLRWLLGSEVRRVYTVARTRALKSIDIDTPDFYQSILEFESGATATIEDSWIFPQAAENIIEIDCKAAGTRGVLYVNNGYTPDIFTQTDGFAAKSVQHFIDCVIENTDPEVTTKDAFQATRIVLAMEESARTGMPVDVGPDMRRKNS